MNERAHTVQNDATRLDDELFVRILNNDQGSK